MTGTDTARHDVWVQGAGYQRYIGRWSRPVAAELLDRKAEFFCQVPVFLQNFS